MNRSSGPLIFYGRKIPTSNRRCPYRRSSYVIHRLPVPSGLVVQPPRCGPLGSPVSAGLFFCNWSLVLIICLYCPRTRDQGRCLSPSLRFRAELTPKRPGPVRAFSIRAVTFCEPYRSLRPPDKSFRVFMPCSSSANIHLGALCHQERRCLILTAM
jgi:hypothetical protein